VRGTLHVAGYTFRPGGFKFKYWRKEPQGTLKEVFVEDDIYGTSTDIVSMPAGDLWLTGSGNWSTRSRVGTPRGSYYHYDASAQGCTRQFLSPEGAVNVDVFCEGPRLLSYRGQVHAFYAAKGSSGDFRLYQKVLSPSRGARAGEAVAHVQVRVAAP
jgi:hypothetical protein